MVTKVSRLAVLVVAAGLTALLLAGCGGDDGQATVDPQDTGPITTTIPAGDAQVTKLEAPGSVDCAGATFTTISITYATSGAKSQQLVVDGLPVTGADVASGTFDVPVHCDPLPHTVVVEARDSTGRPTTKSTTVTTENGAGT
jgi:hypothetical protein